MGTSTALTTGPARLGALGEYVRRRCFFIPRLAQVTMAQNVGKSRPVENRLEGLVGRLCGAKPIAQSHVTLNVAGAVHRACGRTGGAEPSPMARTLHACTAENVAPLARVSGDDWKRSGATPRHPCPERRWGGMPRSRRCRVGPQLRAVRAPGWGAPAVRPAASRGDSARVPTGRASPTPCVAAKRRRCRR